MNDGPTQVSVDLAGLRQIGENHLRALAGHHDNAARLLSRVQYAKGGNLFKSAGSGSADSHSVAYEKWLTLYGLAQEVMRQTVDNLSDVADGVIGTCESYYDRELTNAEKLAYQGELDTYRHGDQEVRESGGEDPTSAEPGDD